MAALNFPASPSNNDTYTANGLTYKYDSTDGVWNLEGTQAVAFARQTSGLSTTTSVGINTDDVDRKTLVGLGNSFNGLYVSCLLYTSPSPRDQRGSRMPSSA